MDLDDLHLSEDVLDSLEKDALGQISRCNSLQQDEKDARDADRHTQIETLDPLALHAVAVASKAPDLQDPYDRILEVEEAIPEWFLTPRGKLYAESQLFTAIPPHKGITREALQKKVGPLIYEVGIQQALKNKQKWLIMENQSELVRKETAVQMCPDHAPKRKRAATDLTLENMQRDDGEELEFKVCNMNAEDKPDGLREMLMKGLPTYLLFESTSGYALLLAHGLHEIGTNFEAIEKYINRFDEVFKLVAFHPFESADEALTQINAISNRVVTEQLKTFLVLNLPKPLEDGKPSFALVVSDPYMIHEICVESKIAFACKNGVFYRDVMRGVRMHIDKFIKDLQLGDFEKAQLHLARSYSRQKLNSIYKGKEVQFKGAT